MQVVTVHPDSRLLTEFLEFPRRIYPGRHTGLPPSSQVTRAELSPDNPFFAHGKAQALLCLDGDTVVGRIVASIDDRRVDEPGVGHFGYFESIECDRVARALLDGAESWIRGRGKHLVEGPIDLNIWTRYRIQVSGFMRAPYSGEPRSPPYYAQLLEGCGYRERSRWHSYDFDVAELQSLCEHFTQRRAMKYGLRKPSPELRRVPWSAANSPLTDLHAAVTGSWTANYGFSYIDPVEFARTFATLQDSLDPSMCFFFHDAARICAFGLGQLDHPAPQLQPARTIMKAYGIIPAYRKTHLVYEILRDLTRHAYAVARLPAVLSLAAASGDLWRSFKTPTRAHAVYGRKL